LSRYALLIATSEYDDAVLSSLRPTGREVDRLAAALRVPGGFEHIDVLRNEPAQDVREAIENFAVRRRHSDVLLVYFGCHAVADTSGTIYLTATNTKLSRLASTTTSLRYLDDQLAATQAEVKVVLLDCCFSGLHGDVLSGPQFRKSPLGDERHRSFVLLSATSVFEYALDHYGIAAEHAIDSRFTVTLARGIKDGLADLNRDGFISAAELYDYVHAHLARDSSTPRPTLTANQNAAQQFLCLSPHGFLGTTDNTYSPEASGLTTRSYDVERWFRPRPQDDLEKSLQLYAQVSRLLSAKAALEAARTVPNELPTEIGSFTGRRAEISAMHRALSPTGVGNSTQQIAIIGPAGVGKTALAVHWARLVADQYPDGQIFLNLGGFDTTRPVDVSQALGRLLRSLRVPARSLPASNEDKRALYNVLLSRPYGNNRGRRSFSRSG